nr:Tx-1040 [Heteropoda pingtungensis]
MKLAVLVAVLCITIAYAKHLKPEYEKFVEETAVRETERECIKENEDCTNNRNGCCPSNEVFFESYCLCYFTARPTSNVPKPEEKCFCDTQLIPF